MATNVKINAVPTTSDKQPTSYVPILIATLEMAYGALAYEKQKGAGVGGVMESIKNVLNKVENN